MGKVLLTKNNIEDYISKNQSELYVDHHMILTSGAQEVIRNRGISIVYEKKQEEKHKNMPDSEGGNMTQQIIKILTDQYGITDAAQIEKVFNLILEKINKI